MFIKNESKKEKINPKNLYDSLCRNWATPPNFLDNVNLKITKKTMK